MKLFASRVLFYLLTISLLVPVSLPVLAAEGGDIASQINIEYEMFKLDNGLTVIVYSDHAVPTVFVGIWYGVGSKDEPTGKTGFAHLFEHLMFQGSANREGDYFAPFIKAGATGMNGTTSQDRTNYYAVVPSSGLDMALWMESDRMTYLLGAIDQAALNEQRDVVKNEKRQKMNRPYAQVYERILENIYPVGHPYHHTTIGSMEDLSNASLDDVHEWFKTYYGASNAVLVLAGDVTVEQAKEKTAFYFSEAPVGKPLVKDEQWIPELADTKKEYMFDRVGQTKLVRAWSLPNLNHEDSAYMYLINSTLAANKNAPLYKILVDDLQLATNVYGWARDQVIAGIYVLEVDLRPGVDPEQVWPIIDKTFSEYMANGPSTKLLEAGKLGVNMRMVSSMESKAAIGRQLAEGQLYSNDPLAFQKEFKVINSATEADLQRVARKWLSGNYYQLTVYPFPEYTSGEAKAERSEIPDVGDVGGVSFPEVQTTTLKNGIKLVVAERDALPLVYVQITTRAGAATTGNPDDAPIAQAAGFLRDRGTKNYDAAGFAAARDAIAMSPKLNTGEESSSISYAILTANLDESLGLVSELLVSPTYPKDELEKYRKNTEGYLKMREKNPGRNARDYFNHAVWGEDSSNGVIWTAEQVARVTQEALAEWNAGQVAPSNTTIYMVGDINLEEAEKAVDKVLGKWKNTAAPVTAPIGEALPAKARVILVDQPGSVQSNIYVGHKLPPYDAETDTELTVVNGILGGGFESRINMNLREDKGWSYGINSRIRRNTSGDLVLSVSGGVQIDKTKESMQEIMKEFTDIVGSRPATWDEFNREILNRTRSIPGRFESGRGFLASIANSDAYGLPLDYAEGAAERLAALTLDGVNSRTRSLLKPDQLTWVVVGDLSKMEEAVRSLNYGEVEVWDHNGDRLR